MNILNATNVMQKNLLPPPHSASLFYLHKTQSRLNKHLNVTYSIKVKENNVMRTLSLDSNNAL